MAVGGLPILFLLSGGGPFNTHARTLCSGRCSLPGVQRVKYHSIVVGVSESIGFMLNIIKGIAIDWCLLK